MMDQRRPATILLLMLVILPYLVHGQTSCQKMDLAIAIPSLNSTEDWSDLKKLLVNTLDKLDIGGSSSTIRIAVVTYKGNASVIFNFDKYSTKDEIKNAINGLSKLSGNGNDVSGAMSVMEKEIFKESCPLRSETQCVAMILYKNNADDKEAVTAAAKRFNLQGVQRLTVGLDENVDDLPKADSATNLIFSSLSADSIDDFASFICTYRAPLCPAMADIVFILDESTSITAATGGKANWEEMKNFVQQVIESFSINSTITRVAMVRFSTNASLEFGFTKYTDVGTLRDSVQAMKQSGGETNYADAFRIVNDVLLPRRRSDVTTICIFITDGRPNTNVDQTFVEINKTKEQNVELYAIGVTDNIDEDTMEKVASSPSHYYYVSNYSKIATILSNITSSSCQVAIPTTTTTTTRSTTTMPTTPRSTTTPPRDCEAEIEIGIILDDSESITAYPAIWNTMKDFIQQIVGLFTISPSLARVGLIKFSTTAEVKFDFNRYNDSVSLSEAIGDLTGAGAGTNFTAAFSVANNQLWPKRRPNVTTICILITDGIQSGDLSQTYVEVNKTKELGIEIYTIGVNTAAGDEVLKQIASDPVGSHNFPIEKVTAINETFYNLTLSLCPPKETTTTTPNECIPTVDIGFILDESASITAWSLWEPMLDFIQQIIGLFTISPSRARVGLIKFSMTAEVKFDFSRYNDSVSLSEAIGNLTAEGEGTSFTAAFTAANNQLWPKRRPNVTTICIFITDGLQRGDLSQTYLEVNKTKELGIEIYAIGVNTAAGEKAQDVLKQIASDPVNSHNFPIENVSAISETFSNLKSSLCPQTQEVPTTTTPRHGVSSSHAPPPTQDPSRGGCGKGDLIFVVDESGSIDNTDFRQIIDFVKSLIEKLDVSSAMNGSLTLGYRVGMMTFGTTVRVVFGLNAGFATKEDMLAATNVSNTGGNTNAHLAIRVAANQMSIDSRPDMPQIIFLITDGVSSHPALAQEAARQAIAENINILVVGIGPINFVDLQNVASDIVKPSVVQPPNFAYLSSYVDDIKNQYLCPANCCDPNPCENGGTCMPVFGGCKCICPEGFSGVNCTRNCSSEIDLVFILDASGSITRERMDYVKNFTVAIVENMNVGPTETRVGAVYFSTSATVAFTLDKYSTKRDVKIAIQNISFVGDRTNLADAQRKARTEILQMSGNRPNVTNVIVILTDAVANEEVSQTIPENILLKNVDIDITETVVITASVGDPNYIDFNMIDRLASQPIHKNIHVTRNFSSLVDLADPIVQSGCNDHDECSPNPCQNGATCVDGNNRYTCLCPVPYTGFDCQRQCSRHYDVVFVLDLSGSVGDANEYPTVTNFTREVVAGLSSSTNVGIVTFDTVARSVFYLNTYTSRRQLLNAINFYTPGGKTNAQTALNEARTDQFVATNGDRSGYTNIVIYVSDGKSDVMEGSSSTANAAQQLKNNGVLIYTVGLTDSPNTSELENISTASNSIYNYYINTSNDYDMVADSLLNNLCTVNLLIPPSPTPIP